MQFESGSATTDANGYVDVTFPNPINGAVASPATPQAGDGSGLVGCSCVQISSTKVRLRFWKTLSAPDSGSVLAAGSEAVTYNVIAF